ncbi:hypothetical protein [Streptomyces coffeae]|uniref:Uncharacterized protein n=1 Tax=Streptomyces coffeae TaxID=621382 RepID=A0ABS1NPT7_9ACTN|nr:hypothetical protein [Streptomyces coffeae]MBL1102106.1 hypothetical protein [Streptomyces coffeae]
MALRGQGLFADALCGRLYKSLDSLPEQLALRTYRAHYAESAALSCPALIPQVCLHYDPYTRKSGKQAGTLYRQRMDFLLLAPDRACQRVKRMSGMGIGCPDE